jgi:hypothetical protein
LKNGDVRLVNIEQNRVVLEKRSGSPVDDSFGLWAHTSNSAEYVNNLTETWEERLVELLKNE